jgi:hypothetical protein
MISEAIPANERDAQSTCTVMDEALARALQAEEEDEAFFMPQEDEAFFMPQEDEAFFMPQEDAQEDAQKGAQEGTRRSGRARKPRCDRD